MWRGVFRAGPTRHVERPFLQCEGRLFLLRVPERKLAGVRRAKPWPLTEVLLQWFPVSSIPSAFTHLTIQFGAHPVGKSVVSHREERCRAL
jgi:hypothetical protein